MHTCFLYPESAIYYKRLEMQKTSIWHTLRVLWIPGYAIWHEDIFSNAHTPDMDKVLCNVDNVVTYFDDIVIFSNSWKAHLKDNEKFSRNYRRQSVPSALPSLQLKCLGHIVGYGSVTLDPYKVKAIQDFPLPVWKIWSRSYMVWHTG